MKTDVYKSPNSNSANRCPLVNKFRLLMFKGFFYQNFLNLILHTVEKIIAAHRNYFRDIFRHA